MALDANLIKQLREEMGAGMLDCKKALEETGGNYEAAKDYLRKKGMAAAAKKSSRVAAEGLVGFVSQSSTTAAIVELNCETDFVARGEKFQELLSSILSVAAKESTDNVEKLKDLPLSNGKKVGDALVEGVASIGENISLRRAKVLSANGQGAVVAYVHNAAPNSKNMGQIVVAVALKSAAPLEKLQEVGKKVAMHIAASQPLFLNKASVSSASLEREKEIFREQSKQLGKPDNVVEKMIEGRVKKYYEDVVLLEQSFVFDNKTRVEDYVASSGSAAGSAIEIVEFVRFQLGDGIEKKQSDFAQEVSEMSGVKK